MTAQPPLNLTPPQSSALNGCFLHGFNVQNGQFIGNVFNPPTGNQVPAGVNVTQLSESQYTSSANVITNQQDLNNYFSASAEIGGSYGFFSGSIGGSYSNFVQSYEFSEYVYGYCFGVDVVLSAVRDYTGGQNTVSEFNSALAALAIGAPTQSEFNSFFNNYGTHFLCNGAFGDTFCFTSQTEQSYAQTSTQSAISFNVTASFSAVTASGKMNASAAENSGTVDKNFLLNSTFTITTSGGNVAEQEISAFLGSAASNPVLLINPVVAEMTSSQSNLKASFLPLSVLLPNATAAFLQNYAMAVYNYYGLAANMVGPSQPVSANTVIPPATPTAVDAMLAVQMLATEPNEEASAAILADNTTDPQTQVGVLAIQATPANGYVGPMAVPFATSTVAVPAMQSAIFTLDNLSPPKTPDLTGWLTPFYFPPGYALGSAIQVPFPPLPAAGQQTMTYTAPTDGFLMVQLTQTADGARSTVKVINENGTILAATSQHYFQEQSYTLETGSLSVPIPSGSTYQIQASATACTAAVTVTFQPIYSGPNQEAAALLGAPQVISTGQLITPNLPGFLVAYLDASAGLTQNAAMSQGSLFLFTGANAVSASTGNYNVGNMGCASAAGFYDGDVYVPFGSFMAPIQQGQQYFFYNTVSAPNAALAEASIYFFPLNAPAS